MKASNRDKKMATEMIKATGPNRVPITAPVSIKTGIKTAAVVDVTHKYGHAYTPGAVNTCPNNTFSFFVRLSGRVLAENNNRVVHYHADR